MMTEQIEEQAATTNEATEPTEEQTRRLPRFEVDADEASYQKRGDYVTFVAGSESARVVVRIPASIWEGIEARIASDALERIGSELGPTLVPAFQETVSQAIADIQSASKKFIEDARGEYRIRVPRSPSRNTEKDEPVSEVGDATNPEEPA